MTVWKPITYEATHGETHEQPFEMRSSSTLYVSNWKISLAVNEAVLKEAGLAT